MSERPLFSIIHPSARPGQWRNVYDEWLAKCSHPQDVEYILVADDRWGFESVQFDCPAFGTQVATWNKGRRCYVDAVNAGARSATGSILIVIADDQFPCEHWDSLFPRFNVTPAVWAVPTGTPRERERGIVVMPVVSRGWYEKTGYIFYPEYESMFADNDLYAHAKAEGCLIEAYDLPVFPHRHPNWTPGVVIDQPYAEQNRREAWEQGVQIFKRRTQMNFRESPKGNGRAIALCLAGENFSRKFLTATISLTHGLRTAGWNLAIEDEYTSNVFVTRQVLLDRVRSGEVQPEYILMIDDDNVVNYPDVERLLQILEDDPSIDAASGWCYIVDPEHDRVVPSCGVFSPDGCHLTHFDAIALLQSQEVREIEWTGFPCFLIRRDAFDKLPSHPFLPILDERLTFKMSGEDAAFCKRAMDAGLKFVVDPRIKLQHIKPRAIEANFPILPPAPKVAAMLRVRNEDRWIRRVIESLVPLCGENIFVMDDESTDDTKREAILGGATVYDDLFPGMPLDEARDKDWLTERVIEACSPDWIFCIDGDEELEPLGTEKILSALRWPAADCYAVKFLYLWDRPDQARFDRWYSTFSRQSLFRVDAVRNLKFRSLYADQGVNVHSGLHVSNSPGGGKQIRTAGIEVFLLHYGYMDKADRIRKYEYYNRIDPGNETEDFYRHIVQGDIPEVPTDAVLQHAGPLEVRKLPRHLVAKDFHPVPLSEEVSAM